jgi:two-component system cell cycle sensor histidine kinase/response regulator CckA
VRLTRVRAPPSCSFREGSNQPAPATESKFRYHAAPGGCFRSAAFRRGACLLLGFAWIVTLRRRIKRQTEQIRQQFEHQARREAEGQHAARLESLGVLAAGIAHDLNNALTGIMGYTSFAMFDKEAMALVGNHLREIERGAHRARDLTQQLLTFA